MAKFAVSWPRGFAARRGERRHATVAWKRASSYLELAILTSAASGIDIAVSSGDKAPRPARHPRSGALGGWLVAAAAHHRR